VRFVVLNFNSLQAVTLQIQKGVRKETNRPETNQRKMQNFDGGELRPKYGCLENLFDLTGEATYYGGTI